MDWTEIIIKVSVADVDLAGDIANMVVPHGIYIEDYSRLEEEALEIAHIDLIDEDLLAKGRDHALIHVYISPEENHKEAILYLTERYKEVNIENEIMTAKCAEEDFINNWKKYFKPIKVGGKLLIRPIWEDEFDSEGRKVLHLEPGLAFGTGTHETTRLCLELLEEYAKENDRVLDVGCGSGILSIGALLLGAGKAVGVDIDLLSVKTAIDNAKINQVEDKFICLCGDLTDKIEGKYDVIIANIVADVIIELLKDVRNYMHENTVFIMSGIIDTRKDDVIKALSNDFDIISEKEDKGWIALAVKSSKS